MAVFVDLDEDSEPPQTHSYHHHHGVKPEWNGGLTEESSTAPDSEVLPSDGSSPMDVDPSQPHASISGGMNLNQNPMTEALGCYPIAMAIASSLDLNSLDNLSRTCRRVRDALLQYRGALVAHTLHCENEDVAVDPEDTLRYRARAGNWFYMEDGRGDYSGKSGSCARDLVAECRRCARIVCRNCAIKPPAPVVLRDRHRRLCLPCAKAPLGALTKPRLRSDTPLDANEMQLAICTCASDGVWLCQPCGRSIRGADHDYQSIWKWRSQYGDVIGGLGTGIGEGDRGVICGRGESCYAAREREQETDCDAEDGRSVDLMMLSSSSSSSSSSNNNSGSATPPPPLQHTTTTTIYAASSIISSTSLNSNNSGGGGGSSSSSLYSRSPNSRSHTPEIGGGGGGNGGTSNGNGIGGGGGANSANSSRSWLPQLRSSSPQDNNFNFRRTTPTPSLSSSSVSMSMQMQMQMQQRPGYARHEIEGIGGVVKTKLVRIVRVGACVPEWEDERHNNNNSGGGGGQVVLGREVSGRARSWCGWCWRVIPGKKDYDESKKNKKKSATISTTGSSSSGAAVIVNNNGIGGVGNGNGNGKGKEREREKERDNGPWGSLPMR